MTISKTAFFSAFSEKYNLNDIEEMIKKWHEFEFYNRDILMYMPSSSVSYDGIRCSSNSNVDKNLKILNSFWEMESCYHDCENAFSRLSDEEKEAFLHHYKGKFKLNHHGYTKEDILVSLASNLDSFEFKESIQEIYLREKKEIELHFKRRKSELKKNLPEEIKKYDSFFKNRFRDEDFLIFEGSSNSGSARSKRDMAAAICLYLSGEISISDLRSYLSTIKGGKKTLKMI